LNVCVFGMCCGDHCSCADVICAWTFRLRSLLRALALPTSIAQASL